VLCSVYIYSFDYLLKFKGNDVYMYSTKFDNGTIIDKINSTYTEEGPYDFFALKATRQFLSEGERKAAYEVNYV
jgi:hypothetical protein